MKIQRNIKVTGNFFNAKGVVQLHKVSEFRVVRFDDPKTAAMFGEKAAIPMDIIFAGEHFPASLAPADYKNLVLGKDNYYRNSTDSYRFTLPIALRGIIENEFLLTKYLIRVNNYLDNVNVKNKEQFYDESINCEFEYDDNLRKVSCNILGFNTRSDNDIVDVNGESISVKLCRLMEQLINNNGNNLVSKSTNNSNSVAAQARPIWNQPTDWFDYKNIKKDKNICNAVYMWIGKSDLLKARYLYIGIAGATQNSKNSVFDRLTAENKKFKSEVAADFEIMKYRFSQLHPHPDAPTILQTVEMQSINEMNSLFKEAAGKPKDATILHNAVLEIKEDANGNYYPIYLLNDKKRYMQV